MYCTVDGRNDVKVVYVYVYIEESNKYLYMWSIKEEEWGSFIERLKKIG